MAIEESTFPVAAYSYSPSALPVNTPSKAIKWRKLEGSFQIVLSAVSSKMRVQLKHNGKVVINMQLNKLTPAQKKANNSPRIAYQDSRMSFRYPSSFQVDNGMSERFQISLDPPMVLSIAKKLNPFFSIIAPSATAQSQAPVPGSSTQALKKRKDVSDAEASQAPATVPKKQKPGPPLPPPPSRPSPPTPAGLGSQPGSSSGSAPVETQAVPSVEATQSGTPPTLPLSAARTPSDPALASQPQKSVTPPSTLDLADPSIEALKAQLLKGSYTPEGTQQSGSASLGVLPRETQLESQLTTPAVAPIVPVLDRISSETLRSQPSSEKRVNPPGGSSTTSVDQVEAEIDLLPRSPLVDTNSQPFTQPARSHSTALVKYASLVGLDFRLDDTEADDLNCAFPPMRTEEEEAAERLRLEMDDAEWREGGAGIESEVSAELQTIWRGHDRSVGLAMVNDWVSRVNVSDDEIFDLLDRGELNQNFLEICYRVGMAAYQQDPPSHSQLLLTGPLNSLPLPEPSHDNHTNQHFTHASMTRHTPNSLPPNAYPLIQTLPPADETRHYEHYHPLTASYDDAYTPRSQPHAPIMPQDPHRQPQYYDQDNEHYDHYDHRQYAYQQDLIMYDVPSSIQAHPYTASSHVHHQQPDDFDDIDD